MQQENGLNRRAFLRNAGMTAVLGAVGTRGAFAEEIDVLRNWRDDFLQASYPGRAFINTYYSLSPPVAYNISESESKRKLVRMTLGPIVKILKDKYYLQFLVN